MNDYEKLRSLLEEEFQWPCLYMFKFLIPANRIADIKPYFEEGELSLRKSSKGNYTSLTAKMMMLSPDAVIEKYMSLPKIEGMISL